MTEVTASGHLAIGEVLSLVQEDFPDVTISKIRFLESQGLIAPERTASGYRKFYDADIDRLRWILRQQRDHFLPLKVIRKMLDQGVDTVDAPGAQPTLWSSPEPDDTDTDSGTETVADAGAEDRSDDERGDERPAPQRSASHPAVSSAAARRAEPASNPVAPPRPGTPSASAEQPPADRPDPAATGKGGKGGERASQEPPVDEETPPADDDAVSPRPAHSTPADVVAALQEDPRRARRPRRAATPTPEPAEAPVSPRAEDQTVTVDRLSRAELCETAGITAELLAGLEDFGLIVPVILGGNPAYDGEALAIARIASAYAALGVEPRHLRMYKIAAEREAGFIEQLVFPLLKQRNPEARRNAVERSEDLVRLGEELHSALLRRQLGPVLGT